MVSLRRSGIDRHLPLNRCTYKRLGCWACGLEIATFIRISRVGADRCSAASEFTLALRTQFSRDPQAHFMSYKEIFWMACDSTEQLRAEYGPFHTRQEAESEAKKLGFGYLLRYEHILGANDDIEEVRCVFIELPGALPVGIESLSITLHTRCATCGESAVHEKGWQAEVWADIHEFEHSRHRVRLFQHARGKGLKEIGDWRG
jgi:hypothetical protein